MIWKGERRAEISELSRDASSEFVDSVEELPKEVEAWPDGASKAELRVVRHLKSNGAEVSSDVAMAIVPDAILGKGPQPAGKSDLVEGACTRMFRSNGRVAQQLIVASDRHAVVAFRSTEFGIFSVARRREISSLRRNR